MRAPNKDYFERLSVGARFSVHVIVFGRLLTVESHEKISPNTARLISTSLISDIEGYFVAEGKRPNPGEATHFHPRSEVTITDTNSKGLHMNLELTQDQHATLGDALLYLHDHMQRRATLDLNLSGFIHNDRWIGDSDFFTTLTEICSLLEYPALAHRWQRLGEEITHAE